MSTPFICYILKFFYILIYFFFFTKRGTSVGIYSRNHHAKTDFIKKLIGENGFFFGDVYVYGRNLRVETRQSQMILGYAPTGLNDFNNYTPVQLFYLFLQIRGIDENKQSSVISHLSEFLGMRNFIGKKFERLHQAQRRKVYIALGMLIFQNIIILDEPTRGMPPNTCRQIWNIIQFYRYCGKSILFTTSESRECEKIADYIIVMELGEMLAQGPKEILVQKCITGFYLEFELLLEGADLDEVKIK